MITAEERHQKAARAMAAGLRLNEAEAASRLSCPPPPPPPDDGSAEYERQLTAFLARAYIEIDPRLSLGNAILHVYLRECLDWAVAYRQWRQQNPWGASWPTAPDLEAEYRRAVAETPPAALTKLRRAGVSDYAIELTRPAYARVQLQQGGLFAFSSEARTAGYIVPIRSDHHFGPETEDPLGTTANGAILDLVLFTDGFATTTALRYGGADWLGNCRPQETGGPPVKLYKSPIDWLRADCDGLVCLATEPAEICRVLSQLKAIDVDREQAERFSGLYSLPLGRPTMFIGGRHA